MATAITLDSLDSIDFTDREVHAMRIGVVTTPLACADDPDVGFDIPSPIYRTMLENELAWHKARIEGPAC